MTNPEPNSRHSISRLSLFGVLWIFFFAFALLLFFQWNGPIRRAAVNMTPLATSLLYVLALCGLGYPLSRLLLSTYDRWIQLLCALAFGAGLTGILSFTVGFLFHFHYMIFICWYLIGLGLFVVAMLRWRPEIDAAPGLSGWDLLAVGIFALFLGQAIPFVVAPEVSNDALAYHLLIPKLYLARGMVYHITLMVAAYYPSLAEYDYLPLLMLSDETVCKCFHFWISIALLLAMSRMIKKVDPTSSSLLGPAFFLSMPVTAIYMGWAWNDYLYTFFVVLSVYFFLHYHLAPEEKRSGRDFFLAGLMGGLASWTKYTFVLFFFSILLLLFWGWRKWKWEVRDFWLFFAGISLVAPFWLFQNWTFTQNPFYPFLNKIFQSPYWPEASNRHFMRGLREYEIPEWSWSRYLRFPFDITMRPRVIDTHTGVLPLVFAPLLFLRTSLKGLSLLKGFLASCILVWLLIHTENRSLFSLFAILFCAASIVLQRWRWPAEWIRRSGIALIIVALASNLFLALLTTYYLFDPVGYFLGRETKAAYIGRHAPSQKVFDCLNSQKEVGRVVLVSMHHPYYLERPYLFSSFSDPPIAEVLTHETKNVKEIAKKFRRLGVTHIVVNRPGYDQEHQVQLYTWTSEKKRQFEQFLVQMCDPVSRFGNDYVFRLKSEKE